VSVFSEIFGVHDFFFIFFIFFIFGVQDLVLLVATKQEGARGLLVSTWSGSIWRRTDRLILIGLGLEHGVLRY
jgi:hypothetical protein